MIGIGLNVRNSVEAAKLYQKAFGMELGYHVFNDDGTFFHSELKKNGEPMLSVVEDKRSESSARNSAKQNEALSPRASEAQGVGRDVEDKLGARFDGNPVKLGFTFDNMDELLAAFELLKDGGRVLMELCELPWSPCAAEVCDRYGVNWH